MIYGDSGANLRVGRVLEFPEVMRRGGLKVSRSSSRWVPTARMHRPSPDEKDQEWII